MKPKKIKMLGIVGGFLPWIIFGVINSYIPGYLFEKNILVIVLTLVLEQKALKKLFILPLATLIFFIFSAINAKLNIFPWLSSNQSQAINFALAGIMWLSILIGKPFTLQYAKE